MTKQSSDDGSKRATNKQRNSTVLETKFRAIKKIGATRTRTSIDCYKKKQCCVALKRLMVHRDGWAFKKRQGKTHGDDDDYGIGSKPLIMDFDTVMRKLEKDMYMETRRFADDVRMVFDNALFLYPPRHEVHRIALKLSELFETKWKSLEEKWEAEEEKARKERRSSMREAQKRMDVDAKSGLQTKMEKEQVALNSTNDVQLQRKRERERLEKMERTVFLDENMRSYQEFKQLYAYTYTDMWLRENVFVTLPDFKEDKSDSD